MRAISEELSRTDDSLKTKQQDNFRNKVHSTLDSYASDNISSWINDNLKPVLKVVEFDTEKMAVELGVNPAVTFNKNCLLHTGRPASGKIVKISVNSEESK